MEVIACIVYGVSPEKVVSHDLVQFVETNIKEGKTFKVKSVAEGQDPSIVQSGVIGFYARYGIAYISNPDNPVGLIGIDPEGKRLVVNPNETAFYKQRDSYVYATERHIYVRQGYEEVLREFEANGYTFHEFVPGFVGDRLIRHKSPESLPVGRSLRLEELL